MKGAPHIAGSSTLNGDHNFGIHLGSQDETGINCLHVHHSHTISAVPLAAAILRTCESQIISQCL
ncbi:MAG: hypothetical protein WA997_12200 [Anaerolineales bacterium]